MIPLDVLGTYFLACLILAIAPGPDNIFVLTQSALQGRKAGILVVLGLCTGLLFHTTAVALGVAVIFKTSELAFTILKVAGALYLLYLAWGAFRERCDGNRRKKRFCPARRPALSARHFHEYHQSQSQYFLSGIPSPVRQSGAGFHYDPDADPRGCLYPLGHSGIWRNRTCGRFSGRMAEPFANVSSAG